jgi:uncharacterized membrane protein
MTLTQWLLALHVSGAFLFLGGSVLAVVLRVLAQRSERPSEVALFLGLTRVAVGAIGAGVAITLVLGLWLVHHDGYSYGRFWIVASLVLWVAANATGGIAGRQEKETRLLAERLAAAGDTPNIELRTRLTDPVNLALTSLSGASVLAILALMIWKPGS